MSYGPILKMLHTYCTFFSDNQRFVVHSFLLCCCNVPDLGGDGLVKLKTIKTNERILLLMISMTGRSDIFDAHHEKVFCVRMLVDTDKVTIICSTDLSTDCWQEN
jgi:hypothetical protein